MAYGLKHTATRGELAQLARAPALHAGGQGFDSLILHQVTVKSNKNRRYLLTDLRIMPLGGEIN